MYKVFKQFKSWKESSNYNYQEILIILRSAYHNPPAQNTPFAIDNPPTRNYYIHLIYMIIIDRLERLLRIRNKSMMHHLVCCTPKRYVTVYTIIQLQCLCCLLPASKKSPRG